MEEYIPFSLIINLEMFHVLEIYINGSKFLNINLETCYCYIFVHNISELWTLSQNTYLYKYMTKNNSCNIPT